MHTLTDMSTVTLIYPCTHMYLRTYVRRGGGCILAVEAHRAVACVRVRVRVRHCFVDVHGTNP